MSNANVGIMSKGDNMVLISNKSYVKIVWFSIHDHGTKGPHYYKEESMFVYAKTEQGRQIRSKASNCGV